MGYLNPVIQYGTEKFIKDAAEAGVDGLILPDMPMYEYEEQYKDLFHKYNLCNTFMITPTTSEDRIRKIDGVSDGFIYAVSASSTTGAKGDFSPEQISYFERVQKMQLTNPYLIGFGISNNATFTKTSQYSAGAIVGSAFVNLLKTAGDLTTDIEKFIKSLKG
jgi:tryptophan synthase alpha chain